MRLGAMIAAMVLAEFTGGNFRFAWPRMPQGARAYHYISEDAGEVFAGDFLQAHLIAQEDFDESRLVDLDDEVVEALRQGRVAPGTMISILKFVSAKLVFRQATFASRAVEAFAGIGFSAPMEEARAMAAADVAAIHLRAGDVIYGHNAKTNLASDKAIPYPLAIDLIARLRAGGMTPLLFGQDADLLAHLRDEHGAYCADDIGDRSGFSPAQNALFDLCLLSRCGRIIGGRSAFCRLANRLAGRVRIKPLERLYEADEAVGIIERHLFDPDASPLISGRQKAFAARYAFVLAGERIARDERFWRLLELARENDPENAFLLLVYACSLYEAGREDEAEAMLWDGWNTGTPTLRWLLNATSKALPGGARTPYIDVLAEQARSGHPMAALCSAIYFTATRQDDRADRMVAILGRVSDPEIRRVAAQILPQLSSQAAPKPRLKIRRIAGSGRHAHGFDAEEAAQLGGQQRALSSQSTGHAHDLQTGAVPNFRAYLRSGSF